MDVVPYIRKISTPKRQNSGLKDNNIRSASGKYSIIKGSTDDFIVIEGFNLNPADDEIRIVNPNTVKTSNVTKASGVQVTLTTTASEAEYFTKFAVSNNISNSGYLEVFTNGIRALNNINTTDAYGTYELTGENDSEGNPTVDVSDYAYAYNREPDYYTSKNILLTDDRYLIVWDMKNTGVKNGYYPVMTMIDSDGQRGVNPVFGYVNKSGGTSGTATRKGEDTYAGSYNASHAMPQRSEFDGTSTTNPVKKEYTDYLIKASTWDSMGMAVDEGGRYYNVSVYNRDGCAMSLIYDRYNEIETPASGYGWGAGTGYSNYTGTYSNGLNNNAITLENVNYGNTLLTERYQYPKLIAKGNSKTGNASVYMAYYDDATGEIVFRDFMVGTSLENDTNTGDLSYSFTYYGTYNGNQVWYTGSTELNNQYIKIGDTYHKLTRRVTNGGTGYYSVADYTVYENFSSFIYSDNSGTVVTTSQSSSLASSGVGIDNVTFAQKVNFLENYTNSGVYNTGRLSVVSTGSKYFDMGVTSGGYIVFVYLDSEDNVLKLVHSTSAVDGSDPTATISWSDPDAVTFPDNVGTYVSMALDGDAVHIAAFDSYDSNLVYMYLPSYDSTELQSFTVDQASAVGNWTQIKVQAGVPYIAYYNATETGGRDPIKLAYPVATKDADGNTISAASNKATPGVDVEPGTAYAAGSSTKQATGYTKGTWEYMTIPSITPPQGGDPKFQNVCLDFDSAGEPVIGYLGTYLEFGKALGEPQ